MENNSDPTQQMEIVVQADTRRKYVLMPVLLIISILALIIGVIFQRYQLVQQSEAIQEAQALLIEKDDELKTIRASVKAHDTEAANESKYSQASYANVSCSADECLFIRSTDQQIKGFARLKGYYQSFQTQDMSGANITCDQFVITGGNETLREALQESNGDRDSLLTVGIGISSLNQDTQNKLVNSSQRNEVEIGVIKEIYKPMGISGCFSPLQVVSVN